ncbi:unannotated protein [freshwater metagenome]|uniref:Unannotated protein n=1 Tax=freshwater metagenome TaxID=449393 RepID=A0A6J6U2R7_9ZZZZ
MTERGEGESPATAEAAFVIDDTEVSAGDIEDRVEVLEVLYGLAVPQEDAELEDFRREAARTFAATLLIGQEAAARGVAVDEAEVSEAIDRFVGELFGGDRARFESALEDGGISIDAVRDEVKLQLDGQALFELVTGGVEVSPAEVRAAYDAEPVAWAVPPRRRLAAIVTADPATARRALDEVEASGDFAAAARRFTLDDATRDQGGLLGTLTRAQLDRPFATAAFDAPVGGYFGPVRTDRGWYVGHVVRAFPPLRSFGQVREAVEQSLVGQRSLLVWESFVEEQLAAADVRYEPAYEPRPDDGTGTLIPGGP